MTAQFSAESLHLGAVEIGKSIKEPFGRTGGNNYAISSTWRIAHINNPSGVSSIISSYQACEGFHSEVYHFSSTTSRYFGGKRINYYSPLSRWRFFGKLRDYDIIHYHYPYGSLKRKLDKLSTDENKIYLKHYHGDDLRNKFESGFCAVSTPDLLDYSPRGVWVPNPVPIDSRRAIACGVRNSNDNIIDQPGSVRIAHYPYYKKHSAGAVDACSKVLSNLQEQGKIQVIEVIDMSHEEALKLIASCDIVIGKIVPEIGWFGKFELEAMSLGKPVITYVADYLFSKYRPPVYNTTQNGFRYDLEALIEDAQERGKLSRAGVEYVKSNHSPTVVIRQLQRCYEMCLEK